MAPSLQMTTCLGIARGGSREIDEEIIMHDCFFVRSECWFSMVLWFCGLATMAQRAPDTRCSPVVEVSQINTSMVYTHDYTCIYRKQRVFLCIRAFYGKPQPRMLWEACIILHVSRVQKVLVWGLCCWIADLPRQRRDHCFMHGIAAWPLFKLQSQEIPRLSSLPISSEICIHSNSIHKTYTKLQALGLRFHLRYLEML